MQRATACRALLVSLLLMTASVAGADERVLTVVAPEYWCPFSCAAGSAEEGFAVDIARAALAAQGIRMHYMNMTYDRALQEVRQGAVDAAVPVLRDEAPDFIFPQGAVSASEYCFYTTPDSGWQFRGEASLNGLPFLATSGYRYGEPLDTYIALHQGKNVSLMQGNNIPDRMIRMVQAGRFDALLDDSRLIAFARARNRYPAELRNAGCLSQILLGFVAFSPALNNAPQLAASVDKGLQQIRANGTLRQILTRYGVQDWQY